MHNLTGSLPPSNQEEIAKFLGPTVTISNIYPTVGDMQAHTYPGTSPPPYPGPPQGPDPSAYPVTNQPHVTVVHPTTTVVGVPAVVVTNSMAPGPTAYICKSCNHQIVTRVQRVPSMRTHLFALLLCIFGFWPCVCIPYCVDSCNNAEHYCPNCNAYIGSYIG